MDHKISVEVPYSPEIGNEQFPAARCFDGDWITAAEKQSSSEKEVRAILRRHFNEVLTKAMLSPIFRRSLEKQIVRLAGLTTALRREARRKNQTKRIP